MILIKSRFFTDAVASVIKVLLNIIYKILKALKIRLLVFVLLAGIILYFTNALQNTTVLVIYIICLFLSIVLSLSSIIKKIFNKDKKIKLKSNIQICKTEDSKIENGEDEVIVPVRNSSSYQVNEEKCAESNIKKYPIFSKVKNSGCIMGEYEDRYELYVKTANGLKKIRVDYKRKI